MAAIRRAFHRLVSLVRPGRAEGELSREISSHLRLLEDQFVARGMSATEARYAARRAFGGVEQTKERQRDTRTFRWLAGWPMDLRLGARMLLKSPGLTAVAVLALAVAIGGGAAYFEFFSDLYRSSLPVPAGGRVVGVQLVDVEANEVDPRSAREFLLWRQSPRALDATGAYREFERNLFTADGRNEPVRGVEITASAFQIAPAPPVLGRPLGPADEQVGAPAVALIGHAVWRDRFGSSPAVVGQAIRLDKDTYTIVGVMPEGFGFPVNHAFWTPLRLDAAALVRDRGPSLRVFGRLAPGVSAEQAQSELAAVALQDDAGVARVGQRRVIVKPYVDSLWIDTGEAEQRLAMYIANLFFIGLLALCAANVATLVFGRTVTRETELTVRTALGASRGRIVSQLVAEALVLTSVAAAIGVAGAAHGLRWVRSTWERAQDAPLPFWWDGQIGVETLGYAALLAMAAALIIGGVPALKSTGPQLQGRLKFAAAGSTMTFGRMWTGIIVAQVAFTVMLLLGVIGLAWSISTIEEQFWHVGFPRGEYRAARFVSETPEGMSDADASALARRRLNEFLRRLTQERSVGSVTYTTRLPGIDQEQTWLDVDGAIVGVRKADIGPNFFEAFGRRVVAGRGFTQTELESDRRVAIVDEAFVRFVLGGRSAIGRTIRVSPAEHQPAGPPIEIVGVTADMSTSSRKSLKDARVYLPIGAAMPRVVDVVVHAQPGYRNQGLSEVATALRTAISAAPEGSRIYDWGPMDQPGEGDAVGFVFTALGAVIAVALLLSTAGIYSLVSFTLARRTREIGIRAALGAAPLRIIRSILARAFTQIGVGVVLGAIPGTAIVATVASHARGGNQLVTSAGVATAVAAFVVAVAVLSCVVPLRRALRIEPTQALRADA